MQRFKTGDPVLILPRFAQLYPLGSGVVVDVCKGHGTWFDRDELQQIIEFIRGGGLDVARAREKQDLEDERQRLRHEQLMASLHPSSLMDVRDGEEERSSIVSAARELLKLM